MKYAYTVSESEIENSDYLSVTDRKNKMKQRVDKAVMIWLLVGLFMVYMQIVIGGITRLTGSGLSITEWEIITGTLPPLTEAAWVEEFEKYKLTPQYEKINQDMEMGTIFTPASFKFIYFWEYLHRLWARTMGFVFLIPFVFFFYRKRLDKSLVRRLGVVVGLAALAATFGWIMVASGLIERPWVNAYKLAIHLCIGISVFISLLWAYIHYVHPERSKSIVRHKRALTILLLLLIGQIFLGGVMSGTKAALFINTWPDLNGAIVPEIILDSASWSSENFNNYERSGFLVSLIQLMHRTVAYFIFFYSFWYLWRIKAWKMESRIHVSLLIFTAILIGQVVLGIITLIKSVGTIPVNWGVFHQGVAVLLLSAFVVHYYYSAYEYEPQH